MTAWQLASLPLWIMGFLFFVADAAYQAEYARWCWRRRVTSLAYDLYELVRNTSPNNDLISDDLQEVIRLTKRECRTRHDANAWLNTYRGRAAMRAALEAL